MEIEVGDFFRDKKGRIEKDIKIKKPIKGLKNDRISYLIEGQDGKIYYRSQIKDTKHSKNIIDLIEVGDYVNGHLVVNKTLIGSYLIECYDDDDFYYDEIKWNEQIKTILTHEMYEQNCYKIGE